MGVCGKYNRGVSDACPELVYNEWECRHLLRCRESERVEERAHLRATTILCLEKYEGGAPAPAEGGLDGAIAARRYCKDVWSVILSFV